MDIEEKLRQLDDVLIAQPNRHLDCSIKDLEEYKFLEKNVLQTTETLWQQALTNVAVKIYDFEVFSITPDIEDVVYELQNANVGMDLCKHYLLLDQADYKYIEFPQKHFLESTTERIDVDTLYRSVANIILRDLEQSVNSIKIQLLQLDKKDWFPLFVAFGLEPYDEYEEEIDEFFRKLNYFLNDKN
jgi:hypothetical protein